MDSNLYDAVITDNRSIIHTVGFMDSNLYDAVIRDNRSIIHTVGFMDSNLYDAVITDNRSIIHTVDFMDSNLYDAVITDNIDILRQMEGRVEVPRQLTPTNNTVLHLASEYGSIKCVQEILSVHSFLLFKYNSRDESPLYLAARQGHYEVVVAHINAAKFSLTVLRNLITKPNVDLETPLHAAVRYNHNSLVKLLLTTDPTPLHPPNKHHETPLYLASIRCYTDIITTILAHCKQPAFGGPDGRTALHAAVLYDGGSECVKLLLKRIPSLIDAVDDYGWTALHYVACNDIYTIVRYLVRAANSLPYMADKKYKRTALHVAASEGNMRVMRELLKYSPHSWELVDVRGQNILHIAVEKARKEVIRFILSHKASSNLLIQRDVDGNTPLHLVAEFGCYVQELMDLRELDWEVLNGKNLTPLDVLHSLHEKGTLADQDLVERTLINTKVKMHWHLWRILKEPFIATEDIIARHKERIRMEKEITNHKQIKEYNKEFNTHMIVAALIATVALTAGFAVPGGFDGNKGPSQGSAVLLRKRAFKTFMVTDTIAVISSISSLFLYFVTTLYKDARRIRSLVVASALLNVFSIIAMMLAFNTGTFAVLSHSFALAITVCLISSVFFLLVFFVIFIKIFRRRNLFNLEKFVFLTKPDR